MALPQWLLRKAVEKGIKRAVQLTVAYLVSAPVTTVLNHAGVTIDAMQLTVTLFALSEVGRNWIKHHFNVPWL